MKQASTELRVVVGIDPGLDGGIAIVPCIPALRENWSVAMPMCTTKIDTKREIFTEGVISCLTQDLHKQKLEIALCVIELVHAMPKQGVTSMFNFGLGYGMLLGILDTLRIEKRKVSPQAWKKVVLDGTTKDKVAAIGFARTHYPNINLVLPRCRTPHDGLADALCLATYGCRLLEENL